MKTISYSNFACLAYFAVLFFCFSFGLQSDHDPGICSSSAALALIVRAMKDEILFKDESYRIVGACFEVYREKGCGFLEPVYQECMEIELRLQGIPFVAQRPLILEYKKCPLRSTYQPDFLCYDKIVLELKACTEIGDEHRAQVLNYLRATRMQLGLLVNFGHYPKVQIERIAAQRGRYAH